MRYVYFFNGRGFTSGLLEYIHEGEYKTLFKQTGVAIPVHGDGVKINGSRARTVSAEHIFSDGDRETLRNYLDKDINKKIYDYILSFWVKLDEEQASEVKAELHANYTSVQIINPDGDNTPRTDERVVGRALLDHTAKGGWQYVSIPFCVKDSYAISEGDLVDGNIGGAEFRRYEGITRITLDGTLHGAQIADVHIAPGNIPKMKLFDATNAKVSVALDRVDTVRCQKSSGAYVDMPVGKDFFMTESDVICTGKEMCRAKAISPNGSAPFVMTCNAGTKRISDLTEIRFYAEGQNVALNVATETDEHNGNITVYTPSFAQATEPSTGDHRSYTYISYAVNDDTDKTICYARRHTHAVKHPDGAVINAESHEYEWQDAYGRTIKKRDAYGVTTETEYDACGNVVKTKIGSDAIDETIEETFSYDENGERLVGVADGISGQAIHTTAEEDPVKRLTISSAQSAAGTLGENKSEYEYNAFGDQVREVKLTASGKAYGQNTLRFDKSGRLAYVSPHSGCEYEIKYDRFGNATEFYLGETLLLSKEYDHKGNKIAAVYHRTESEKDRLETEYDAYGRMKRTTASGAELIKITYEDETAGHKESAYCADIKELRDGSTGEKYTYAYDEYTGQPTSYTVTGDGKEKMSVRCIGANKIQYKFATGYMDYEDEISYDEECLISPRVKRLSNNNVYGMEWTFSYDALGRYAQREDTSWRNKHPKLEIAYKQGTYLKEKMTYSGSARATVEHAYDSRGNVTKTKETRGGSPTETKYTYDEINRLTKEENGAYGITREYTYDEEGNIATVKEGDTVEERRYDRGRLIEVKRGNATTERYRYDLYGNPTHYNSNTQNMYWERGTLLKRYGDESFVYDGQGKLHTRTANGRTHRMYYDGDKLIAMEIGDKVVRYFYDLEGIAGFKVGIGELYSYIKDGQGNVIGLANEYGIKARYEYDAWGRCRALDASGNEITDPDAHAVLNPMRWKSQYYDTDSGLYYIDGRWYDPKQGRYISAASPEQVIENAGTVFGLNLYALVLSNPVALTLWSGSVYPSMEFYYDGEYKTWWDTWGRWVMLGIGVAATIAACIAAPFTCGSSGAIAAIGMTLAKIAIGTAVGTAMSLAIGGTIAGLQSARTGHGFWQSFAEHVQGNAVGELITSFAFSAVTVAASNIVRSLQCFKEGTLVETEEGLKPIEEIEEGDKVLAYDEETGEQGYKEVVRLFRNETTEWYHVRVNGEDIVCTGGHPFYILNVEESRKAVCYEGIKTDTKGKWVQAKDLKATDRVLLFNGSCGIIETVEVERLEKPETTYNFEVQDFHTYYVGKNKMLVHNDCAYKYLDEALQRQGLDRVPEGGFKETWIRDGYKFEVRAHVGNPQYTNAKQIFRVSRRPVELGKSAVQYLGSNGTWYGMNSLLPNKPLFDPLAAALTHIPLL